MNRRYSLKLSFFITAITVFICSQALAQIQDIRPIVTIPWTDKSPVIDGNIGQTEWVSAAGVAGFIEVSGSLFSKPANARIAWNDSGIFICFTSTQNSIQSTSGIKNDDDSVAGDDAVEVFLQAKPDRYCHFITNSTGAK